MTDLALKASDISITSMLDHNDGSYMAHFDISIDGVFGDVEACYDLEFSNPVENTFYRLGEYFENVEVKFTHFSAVLDDEEIKNPETIKTAISDYIISDLA